MGIKILFYCLLYPLSLLPLWLLNIIFYPFYLLITYVIPYRKDVTLTNVRLSFPKLNEAERLKLYKQFQRHLIQLGVEMLKMLTISKKSLLKRYRCVNPELISQFYKQGRSVILVSGHYNNWEWMVLALDMLFEHHGVGVGKPNTDKNFEKLINRARTRYGTEVVFQDRIRERFEYYETHQIPAVYMMLSDQSPNDLKKAYYTQFLNQESAMIYGPEYFAKKYNIPVVYYQVNQVKRGYYEVELTLITEEPHSVPYGGIIEQYVTLLEETVCMSPPQWLWSHKRWKNRKNRVIN